MAITVITTPGAEDANSYCSRADANTYHESRLHNSDWTGASDDTKDVALVMATRILDMDFEWSGVIASSSQALRWPRAGVVNPDGFVVDGNSIPDFLRDATAEFAMWLIASDRLGESGTAGFSQIKLGPLFAIVDKMDRVGRVPRVVKAMLAPYGASRVSMVRTLERA